MSLPVVFVYRWRLKPGFEEQFREGWKRITLEALEEHSSFGSRLHRGENGDWLAYAVWPSKAARDKYFQEGVKDDEAVEMMTSAVEHRYDELHMEVTDDFILAGAFEHYDEGG